MPSYSGKRVGEVERSYWRHDTQPNDTQHCDTRRNDAQHYDTQRNSKNVAFGRNTPVMLTVVVLSAFMLSVIVPNVY